MPTLLDGSIFIIHTCITEENTIGVENVAIFMCDPYYPISGYGYSTCLGQNAWSTTPPLCHGTH